MEDYSKCDYFTQVAVVGCGSMGSATISHLARRGVKVIGIEQFTPSHDFGSHAGWTRIIRYAYAESPHYTKLALESGKQFKQMQKDMGIKLYEDLNTIHIASREDALIQGPIIAAKKYNLPYTLDDKASLQKAYP